MMNQHICRCCLLENPTLTYNIFDDNNIIKELQECVPANVNLERADGLPEVICGFCRKRISEMFEFRRRCEETDRELRKRYDDTNKAIEVALKQGIMDHIEEEVDGLLMINFAMETPRIDTMNTPVLNGLGNLEKTIMQDLLLEDCSLSGLPPATTTANEDPLLSELLNEVLSEPVILEANGVTNDSNNINQNSDMQNSTANVENTGMKTKRTRKSRKTPQSLHPCTECEKKFTRNFQLKLHMISVHNLGNGLQYQCNECQKTFASRHSLSYHYKSLHSAERPFGCTHCTRRFVLRTQLASHLRTHTGETKPRIFKCLECNKSWPTKSDLRTHMRSHNPHVERPYKCDTCEKSFFTRGHLASHILVHTGEKPFVCVFCDKSYQSVGNLNNHMVRCHHDEVMGTQSNANVITEL